MNGYLMQERVFQRGADCFVESFSPENRYGVVFEDDGETAYFYAVEKDAEGNGLRVLDALHVYEAPDESGDGGGEEQAGADMAKSDGAEAVRFAGAGDSKLLIIWSRDWLKAALVIDGFCHAIFDFEAQGGYNINEFPPPNEVWTKGESRKLTDELVSSFF